MIRGVTEPWFTVLKRLVLLAILAVPFFVVLDESSVWDANEAFYVQTPREMIQRGDWIVPYFNGEPRLNKPPLSYWLVGGFYKLFGVSLFWERLVLALLGFGSVLLVYAAGKLLFNPESALLAAGILATTFRLLMLSRRLLIDVLLLFCLLAVLVFFLQWLKRERPAGLVWAAVFLGLAFLTKGPVALLAPVFLGAYLAISGDWRRLKTRQLILPGAVFLLIASSWFLLLFVKLGWDPVLAFFLKENLGRFSNVDYGPARSLFYYVGVFLGDFFPWSLFFVIGAHKCWRGVSIHPQKARHSTARAGCVAARLAASATCWSSRCRTTSRSTTSCRPIRRRRSGWLTGCASAPHRGGFRGDWHCSYPRSWLGFICLLSGSSPRDCCGCPC